MARVSKYYDVKRDERGNRYLEVNVTGFLLTRIPLLNKGTAFTADERTLLELDGLLPPHVATIEEQKERNYRRYRLLQTPLDKHIFLRDLQDRNEVLFYALLVDHLEEMMPIIYTPTVGEAVRLFSHIYRLPRGLTVSTDNIGRVEQVLENVPLEDVRLVVATDSSAILGIGDQGFGGMAISIGKLSLYTAAGGVAPDKTLPVELDVGTDRDDLLSDPLYLGVRHKRLRGQAYLRFMDRFVEALKERYPKVILQWEDLSKDAAFTVLERYRKQIPSFNDDIQGTGAVALAGLINAVRMKGERLADQRFLVFGAGAGGIGVARAIRDGLIREGLSPEEALSRIYVLDSKGLLLKNRAMEPYKAEFAHDPKVVEGWQYSGMAPGLLETIRHAGITALLGLSGQSGAFSQPVVEAMLENTDRPIIFPLSNPTANAEAVPEDILAWTDCKAIVATGSPFPPVECNGRLIKIGQGNNAFVFPGIGFGAVLAHAREVTDEMILAAAYALAEQVTDEHRAAGLVYPEIHEMRDVSKKVATAVLKQAIKDDVATYAPVRELDDAGLAAFVAERFWEPKYLPFVRGKST